VHQVVQHNRGEVHDGNEWVGEEHIKARHFLPIVTDPSGQRASIWPAKWALGRLASYLTEQDIPDEVGELVPEFADGPGRPLADGDHHPRR